MLQCQHFDPISCIIKSLIIFIYMIIFFSIKIDVCYACQRNLLFHLYNIDSDILYFDIFSLILLNYFHLELASTIPILFLEHLKHSLLDVLSYVVCQPCYSRSAVWTLHGQSNTNAMNILCSTITSLCHDYLSLLWIKLLASHPPIVRCFSLGMQLFPNSPCGLLLDPIAHGSYAIIYVRIATS